MSTEPNHFRKLLQKLTDMRMMEGLVSKKVWAFYIFGQNSANTEPDIHRVEHEPASAEFLMMQNIFQNETKCFAHVILPAADWHQNDGTFSSSGRGVYF